jgi:hypothetical protein
MSVVEIHCPNCGSPSIKKNGTDYCCDNCGRLFQIVAPTKKESKPIGVVPNLKFGKVNFKLDQAKQLGNFVLDSTSILNYSPFQIFRYHAHKKVIKGSKEVIANEFGYIFLNPFTGSINTYLNKTNKYPEFSDCKHGIYQEAMKILNSNALEDNPPKPIGNSPTALPLAKLQNLAFSWIAQNLSVEKTYIQPTAVGRRTGDMGIRGIVMKFSKRDFVEFCPVVAFWLPVFNLVYKHPESNKLFKRAVSGFSGEILNDELRCSKTKMLGKTCDSFPHSVCSSCNNLVCTEHARHCEKCGGILCENCGVSKGTFSKHYFCSKCV